VRSLLQRDALAIALLAAVVRLVAWIRQPELSYDGTYYLRQAERLLGGSYDFIGFPPGYPLAIAAARGVAGDWVHAGRGISFACGVAVAVLTLVWSRRWVPPAWAFAAALAVALHPHHARISVEVLSEPLYGCVLLLVVLLFESRRDAIAGLLSGFAFLIRPEGLLLYVGLIAVRAARTRRVPWSLLCGTALVAGYSILASRAVGHPVITPKQGQLDLGPEVAARAWILVQTLHACFPLLLVPGAIAIGIRRSPQLLAVFAATAAIPFFTVHVQERIHLPALPLWIVLGCAWMAGLAPAPRRLVAIAAAILLGIGLAPGVRLLWNGFEMVPHARAIGTALRPHLQWQDRVAGRFPLVPYYAGAGFVRAPRLAIYPALMDSVLRAGATHLLVLEGEVLNVLPQLRPLFEDAAFVTSDSRIAAAATLDAPPGQRAILYRLSPAPLGDELAIVATRARSTAWCGDGLVVASDDGDLHHAGGDALVSTPENESEPARDGDGIVCIQGSGESRVIARWHPGASSYERYEVTRADRPRSPTAVGEAILYVRCVPPIGLRVLDRSTGRVHPVRLQGLDADTAVPRAVTARGRSVAVTYVGPNDDEHRILATCEWPRDARGEVEMPGRWATSLQFADDAVAWLPEGDAIVASLSIGDEAAASALCAVHRNGYVRRLSFDFPGARRPALAGTRVAFVDGSGAVHAGTWNPDRAKLSAVRTFRDPERR